MAKFRRNLPKGVIITEIYVVISGDTLFAISQRHGVSLDSLIQSNPQINPHLIYPGDEIIIPTPGQVNDPPAAEASSSYYQEVKPAAGGGYVIPRLVREFPQTFFLKGNSGTRRVALTFDDGPDTRYTPQILKVLEEYEVQATFFLLGVYAKRYPEVVRQIFHDGHVIGNHSWSHADFSSASPQRISDEVLKTEDLLQEIIGTRTALIRPPYGAVTRPVIKQLQGLGYKIINWSVDSEDWRESNTKNIMNNTLKDLSEEAILLFHAAGGNSIAATVKVLPELITVLRNLGYVLVAVDDLLHISAYKGA